MECVRVGLPNAPFVNQDYRSETYSIQTSSRNERISVHLSTWVFRVSSLAARDVNPCLLYMVVNENAASHIGWERGLEIGKVRAVCMLGRHGRLW